MTDLTTNPYANRLGLDIEGSGYDWATHEGVKVIGDFHHYSMIGIVWPPESQPVPCEHHPYVQGAPCSCGGDGLTQ
jgi:hypothetical protein|tara:strand:- start:5375 stop:5602 length:228 start_codon:yes stop_codon:yes gene_type:complete